MKVYPTKFEAYEEPDCCDRLLFRVEAFDECVATIHIDTLVSVKSWDEIAEEIRKCLVAMELT